MVVAQVDHRQDYFLEGPLRYLVNVAQKKALAAEEILHKTVELRWLEDNKGLWFDVALVDESVDSMLVDSVWVVLDDIALQVLDVGTCHVGVNFDDGSHAYLG